MQQARYDLLDFKALRVCKRQYKLLNNTINKAALTNKCQIAAYLENSPNYFHANLMPF